MTPDSSRRSLRLALAVSLAAVLLAASGLWPASSARAATAGSVDVARVPYPTAPLSPPTGLDEATKRAEELQRQVDDSRAEGLALDSRIDGTSKSILRQSVVVDRAKADAAKARAAYDERVVSIYKSQHSEPLLLLLGARDLADMIDRGQFILSIVDQDRQTLADANTSSEEAAYQAQQLDSLKSQQLELRRIQEARQKTLEASLAEQKAIVDKLNAQQKAYIEAKAKQDALVRAQWAAGSYSGFVLPKVPAVVDPYTDRVFMVDQGEPTHYVATGRISTEISSWYGNADNAPTPTSTASGRAFNENEFTCASLKFPFWTRLAVSYGGKNIIVTVTDHGPYISGRTLDLSKSAAHALGFDGVASVTCEEVTIK